MPDRRLGDFETLVALAWPMVVVVGTIAVLSASIAITAFWRRPEAIGEIMREITQANVIARLVALVLIIPAITALGLTDRVDNNAAIAALSAIGGYILGTVGSIPPRNGA